MGVLHINFCHVPAVSIKNHPSRHGSIALPVPEVPKISVGAKCFTSSGSNGSCWLVLVPPPFFLKELVFFSVRDLRPKKNLRNLHQKNFSKKCDLRPPQKASYAYFHNRAPLSSAPRGGRIFPVKFSTSPQRVNFKVLSFDQTLYHIGVHTGL